MDNMYLVLVIVLFALAFSDLIVGVSNDAVNFLNSAIGSKVAPRYVIMILASLGILVGATFSSGMMEVARKGIFFPDQFYFSEIMIIFLAVMIADVILLDLFNTFGLPTSTTVSIVFELLGAAVAVSLIKIYSTGGQLSTFINSATALLIISGILLSIVVAFTLGTIVQYLTRIIFTFNFKKNIKYYGAIWGATSITSITYFILIKGAKGSSFISPETLDFIKANTMYIIMVSFLCWTILFQLIIWLTRINILKIIILVGTFALAMAFAGNDLVNFIGVPLAGFSSYKAFAAEAGADPNQFLMTSLTGKVQTETYMLIIAGLVMAVTLWFSRKARTVSDTEINLSRQGDGEERFGASTFSKNLVRGAISIINTVERFVPKFVRRFAARRFTEVDKTNKKSKKNKSSFDLIRASVNLTVASILISFATSLKLPLSTTYVTFMVAMGSSFGDGAWGRESAVYRVSGVTSVIGGWFLTAFLAFVTALTFAYIISYGGSIALTALIILAVLFIVKTHTLHRKRETEKEKEVDLDDNRILRHSDVVEKSSRNIIQTLEIISKSYTDTIKGLAGEDRKSLKDTREEVEALNKKVKKLKSKIHRTIDNLREESIETGHYYVQVLDYLREMAHSATFMLHNVYEHIDNNHSGLSEQQIKEFDNVSLGVEGLLSGVLIIIKEKNFDEIANVITNQQELLSYIGDLNRTQLKRIKKGEAGTKNGLLYLGVLSETKNLLLQTINLLKAERDFIIDNKVL
jgi:phosphate/sulfate permease